MSGPLVLRVPLNRELNPDGERLNVGTDHVDVPVVVEPTLGKRGEIRYDYDYNGYAGRRILLREWNEQVLLHEILHVVLDPVLPVSAADPHNHNVISRIEVALWETGWRWTEGDAVSGGDVEAVVEVLEQHALIKQARNNPYREWWECLCGESPKDHRAHVAAAITDWLAAQIAAAEQRGREEGVERIASLTTAQACVICTKASNDARAALADLRAKVEALADRWERSDDRGWVSNQADELRDLLDGGA